MEQRYLIKQVYQYDFLGQSGTKIVNMESRDIVSNYMFRFRRSDVQLRNEHQNYSNWAFEDKIPQSVSLDNFVTANPNNFYITGNVDTFPVNRKMILQDLAITAGGVYRENKLDSGVFNYIEKYLRTTGNAKNGLYCYNFCR